MVAIKFLDGIKNIINTIIYPQYCVACRKLLENQLEITFRETPLALCTDCFKKFRFIEEPYCKKTGIPLEYDLGKDIVFGEALLEEKLYYRNIRACTVFNDISRDIIHRFKYSDETYLANFIGKHIYIAAKDIIAEADIIIPVPINLFRMVKRKYNQAALLATIIANLADKPADLTSLIRNRATQSQTGLNLRQRSKNVQGAFDLDHRRKNFVKNKNIVLVDDLITTGTTCSQCAKVLKRFGAAYVDVVAFARVVLE